uniref:Uncharacterized protein n=1 Tax=Arion vulgaris TaxID=1028688 RepID=A0A0B7A214_9EUPU
MCSDSHKHSLFSASRRTQCSGYNKFIATFQNMKQQTTSQRKVGSRFPQHSDIGTTYGMTRKALKTICLCISIYIAI